MPRIRISIWLPAALCFLYHALPGGAFLSLLAATTIHEIGHILCITYMGAGVTSLTLRFGGAVMDTTPLTYGQEVVCSLGGPLASLLLLLFRQRFPWLGFWGAVQGLYNLLPVYPLDGGRALRGLLGSRLTLEQVVFRSRCVSGFVLVLLLGLSIPGLGGNPRFFLFPAILVSLLLQTLSGLAEKT